MKKLLVLIFIIFPTLLMSCAGNTEDAKTLKEVKERRSIDVEIGPTNGLSENDYLFGFSWGSVSEYYEPMPEMIRQACTELQIPISIAKSPENWIQKAQNKCLDEMIADGAKGIFMMTSEPEAGNLKITEMVDDGIPVVCLGGAPAQPSKSTMTLATDVYQCSYDATLALLEAMNYQGNIVAITGADTDTNSSKRLQAVDDACKQYENVKILASQKGIYSQESSLEIVGKVLSEYGEDIDGVVAMDYYAAYAMAYYLLNDDAYSDIICIGLDSDKLVIKAIEEGKMLGSMSQNPWAQAYLGVYTLKMLKDGWTYKYGQPYFVDTGNFLITKENVANYADIAKEKTYQIAESWTNRFDPPARLRNKEYTDGSDGSEGDILFRITAIIPQSTNGYWKLFEQGLVDNLDESVSAKIEICQEIDVNQQLEKLDTAIAANVDCIILYPTEDAIFKESLIEAYNKGIKVILVDSDIEDSNRTAYIGCDNYEAGQLAAQALMEISSGEKNIAILVGNDGQAQQDEREQGFIDEIGEAPGYEIVCTEYSNADAVQATAKIQYILKAYPQTNVILVLSPTDTDSVIRIVDGRVNKKTYSVVAFNGAELAKQYIKNGSVRVSVETDPYVQGKRTARLISDLKTGKRIQDTEYTPIKVLTKDHIQD